jgi:hypothetical protein
MRPDRRAGWVWACELCSSSKKLRGLSVRARARPTSTFLIFSVLGVFSFLSPPRRAFLQDMINAGRDVGPVGRPGLGPEAAATPVSTTEAMYCTSASLWISPLESPQLNAPSASALCWLSPPSGFTLPSSSRTPHESSSDIERALLLSASMGHTPQSTTKHSR